MGTKRMLSYPVIPLDVDIVGCSLEGWLTALLHCTLVGHRRLHVAGVVHRTQLLQHGRGTGPGTAAHWEAQPLVVAQGAAAALRTRLFLNPPPVHWW